MSGQLELAPGKLAHPSGALWLPESGCLLAAGVHLGFGWSGRRRKESRPVLDGGAHKRLETLVKELKPRAIVLLGGLVELPAAAKERIVVEGILREMARRAEILIVGGSHARAAAREFAELPLRWLEVWRHAGIVAVRGDKPVEPLERGRVLVLGHIHPAADIYDDAGNVRRLPAFLKSRRAIVLPAFSPLAEGVDVSRGVSAELRELLGPGPVQVAVTTGKRVVPLKLLGGG